MSDEAELRAKIAAISGKINQHKQHRQATTHDPSSQHHHPYQASSWRKHQGWAPYSRDGRHSYPAHKNRTLVLNGQSSPPSGTSSTPDSDDATSDITAAIDPSASFVSMRGINKQLMNKETYDREAKQKLERRELSRVEKHRIQNRDEQSRLASHFDTSTASEERVLKVEGVRFRLQDDGSKLVRIPGELVLDDEREKMGGLKVPDPTSVSKQTPKKTMIAGIAFMRTKNGNLIRATVANNQTRYSAPRRLTTFDSSSPGFPNRPQKRAQCQHFTKNGTLITLHYYTDSLRTKTTRLHSFGVLPVITAPGSANMFTGNCPFGPSCRFEHDPSQVAICKEFLHHGSCALGENCDLSHEPTYHRVSACTHFLRGNCTNAACRYPHINVSSAAPVCRPFATLGYCAKGPECDKRHVIECPDYANTGHCANRENGKCHLPHPDRASALRKAAQRKAKLNAEGDSDISSEDEQRQSNGDDEAEDVDSDDIDDDFDLIMGNSGDESHELTQQQDYVAFS